MIYLYNAPYCIMQNL